MEQDTDAFEVVTKALVLDAFGDQRVKIVGSP
jgi:hypothetical protein